MNAATITESDRRALWLADRRSCITGTDLAAILGLSKFSSPIQVYLDKKGQTETTENEAMRWGRRLERPILEAYADTVGEPIEFADPFQLIRCPAQPLLGASLDARWAHGDRRPVDAKNTRQRTADWGEPGTDQIPVWYAAQLTAQMAVTGAPCADLAVLFSGQEFARFTLYRDLEAEAMVLDRVAAWWERHIINDVPPDMDGSDSSSAYLAGRFRRNTDLVLSPTPEARELVRIRQEADAEMKAAETQKKEAENKLKAIMGEAQAITGLCTWKNNKDGLKVNYEDAYTLLVSAMEQNREGVPVRQLAQQILTRCTTTTPGARVLRFSAR